MNLLLAFGLLLLNLSLYAAEPFEGIISIEHKDGKEPAVRTEIKVKGKMLAIRQTENPFPKYDRYIVNLETRDFYTVSTKDKAVLIKYNLDQLLEYYEKQNLRDGYKRTSDLQFKITDKVKEEEGQKLVKYTAENSTHKGSFWLSDIDFNLAEIIPLLRLLNGWNEAQIPAGFIAQAEVTNKVSKNESTLRVNASKQSISMETFELPKDYLQKDFASIMDENKGKEQLKTIIKSFAGF